MFSINGQKNHARQLLSLILATAMLTSIFAVTSYSATRSRSSGVANTNGATSSLIQPQTSALKANGKIAFVTRRDGNSEIYLMDPDGGNQTNLTNNSADDYSPAWSPDGAKIAFVSNRNGNEQVFLMNADGSNPMQLTFDLSYSYRPSWSPDGTRIAFSASQGEISPSEIFVISSDGSHLTRLTNATSDLDWSGDPAWSPDGTRIVFDKGFFFADLYVINADGSNETRLTTDGWSPYWSPDGAEIVFARSATPCYFFDPPFVPCLYEIFAINATGNNSRQLTTTAYPFSNSSPTWSPDGTRIAFERGDYNSSTNTSDIYVMNADGSNQTSLTSTRNNSAPSWQPVSINPLPSNPLDDPYFFVHQQYRDFLNREPDAPGLAHWVDEITSCNDPSRRQPGESLASCIERKRASTSAAFFLSPEFQNTGSFVLRVYWGTLGKLPSARCGLPGGSLGQCRPLYNAYLADMSQVAQGIVVNDKLAPDVINANKHAFVDGFVNRSEFKANYDPLNNQQFVDKLFSTTGIAPSDAERSTLVNGLNTGAETRSSVVFKVVDGTQTVADGALVFNTRYGQAFYSQEFDSAFVFMEYVGYLHRNPDEAGYEYWLAKLKQYGNWVDAEMVLAFIRSPEYRLRFAQP